MADNLARMLRMGGIFNPDIPLETGFPGGPVVLKPNRDIGINEDWSWIHGGSQPVPTRPGDPGLFGRVNIRDAALGQPNQQPQQSSTGNILDSLYTPSSTYSDMYSKELANMPQRQKPGLKNKILAGIAGFGLGPKAMESALYGDYDEKLADWETRMKYLQPAMQYERYQNANERMAQYQAGQLAARDRQYDLQAERDRRTAEARDYANQIRAQVAKGGQVVVDDKTNQAYMVYKDGSKVPLDITKLSPLDLEEFRQSGRMALEDKRQAGDVEIEKMRESGREELRNLSDSLQRQLLEQRYELMGQLKENTFGAPVQAYGKDNKPLDYLVQINGKGEVRKIPLDQGTSIRPIPPGGGGSNAVQSETQKAAGLTNKARQVMDANPGWKPYVKFDPKTGKFLGLKQPGRYAGMLMSGPSEENYNRLYEAIYGEPFTATPVKVGAGNATPPAKEKPPPAGAKPGGKWITTKWGDVYEAP